MLPYLIIAVLACGCLEGKYRYVDVAVPVAAQRAEIERAARAKGFTAERYGDATIFEPVEVEPGERPSSVLVARFDALGPGRTRIEFRDDIELSEQLLPAPRGVHVHAVASEPWSDLWGIGLDPAIGVGVGYDPEHGMSGRIDGALRFSKRLARFGAPDAQIRERWSLISGVGVGVRFGPEGEAFRPEVSIALSRQRSAWFVPRWQLPTGNRVLVDLSVAGLIERDGRRGFEVGVALKGPPWVSLYARGGAMRGSGDARGGAIVSFGIEGGTFPTIAALVFGAVIGAVAAKVSDSVGDGVQRLLGGG